MSFIHYIYYKKPYLLHFILLNILFISIEVCGQNSPTRKNNEGLIESIISKFEDLSNINNQPVDKLVDKVSNPLDLNTLTSAELTDLFILSPQQVKAILDYRTKVGRFYSVYELQFIYQLDRVTLHKLAPFVYVQELSTIVDDKQNRKRNYIKHELSTRLSYPLYEKKGDDNYFLGYPFYHNLRYLCKINSSIEFGFTAEKDSGEPLFGEYNKWGYDYYSYYLILKNINNIERLALGKYRLHLGLGLVMGAAQFGGKWSQIQSFFSKSDNLVKHSSVSEFDYLRGAAFIYKIKGFSLLPFYSNHLLDGNVGEEGIRSIRKTGQHRSIKDFQYKNTVVENIFGLRTAYSNTYFEIGVNGIYYFFNKPLLKSNLAYKSNDIQGNNFYNGSIDYTLFLNQFIWKGEVAKGVRGLALLQKLYYSPFSALDMLFIYRYYSPDYWAFHGRSFGNQSAVKNENGLYLNIQSSYFSPLNINAYVDYCSYAKPHYKVSKPSKAIRVGVELDYTLDRKHHFLLRYAFLNTIRDATKSKGKLQELYQSMKIRVEYLATLFNKSLMLKTFSEYSLLKTSAKESGYQLSQRLTYYLWKLKLALQYSYICGSSFDNRFYIYEPNLLYNSYIPSFYGLGHRFSALIQYQVTKSIGFTLKCGCTNYEDRQTIGSGYDEIAGHRKLDLEFMARIKF